MMLSVRAVSISGNSWGRWLFGPRLGDAAAYIKYS